MPPWQLDTGKPAVWYGIQCCTAMRHQQIMAACLRCYDTCCQMHAMALLQDCILASGKQNTYLLLVVFGLVMTVSTPEYFATARCYKFTTPPAHPTVNYISTWRHDDQSCTGSRHRYDQAGIVVLNSPLVHVRVSANVARLQLALQLTKQST